jgi:hypothetical protein
MGITPKLSDTELVTLAMLRALLGFTSQRRWIRHARAHLLVCAVHGLPIALSRWSRPSPSGRCHRRYH